MLRLHVLPELRARAARARRLSIWSAGCSTGQEAYSLAMCAMDDGTAGDFTVWGGDISHHAIKIARRGPLRSARRRGRFPITIGNDTCARSTTPTGTEYEIVDELRQRVRFMTTNLVEPDGFRPSHDVVVCHNVLIYFSPAAVTRAVSWLASCVALGGYLMLGPGEAPNDRPAGLEPVVVNGVACLSAPQRPTRRGAIMNPLDAATTAAFTEEFRRQPAGDRRRAGERRGRSPRSRRHA